MGKMDTWEQKTQKGWAPIRNYNAANKNNK
jgi:hypothetical protein